MKIEPHIQSILLTTAFRDLSRRAAPVACMLARTYGARIHVVHVLEGDMETIATPDDLGAVVRTEPSRCAVAEAHAWLSDFVHRHVAPLHEGVLEAVVHARSVHKAICSYARECRIDLIVMGTHGDSMLHRMLHGSISKAVVEHAPCPVMLVPCPRIHEPSPAGAASISA